MSTVSNRNRNTKHHGGTPSLNRTNTSEIQEQNSDSSAQPSFNFEKYNSIKSTMVKGAKEQLEKDLKHAHDVVSKKEAASTAAHTEVAKMEAKIKAAQEKLKTLQDKAKKADNDVAAAKEEKNVIKRNWKAFKEKHLNYL